MAVDVGEEPPVSVSILGSLAFLSLLLVLGHFIRTKLWWLRRIYLPASLIGGLIGLLIIQLCTLNASVNTFVTREMLGGWQELPTILICVVFGCLFLGEPVPSLAEVWKVSGPQLLYGQMLAWGQYAWPALVTAAILVPTLNVNPLIAPVVALGFEGGHGTAAGLRETFQQLDYNEGAELALCAATVGLILGVLFGTLVVNWAVVKGHVDTVAKQDHREFNGVYPAGQRPTAGRQTVSVDALDSAALHMGVIGCTLAIAYAMKRLLMFAEGYSEWLSEYGFFTAFPSFPFCMFGGIVIQVCLDKFAEPSPIDRDSIERLSGLALDYTVVSAVATMEFSGIQDSLAGFFILLAVTLVWHLVAFFFLARHLLPNFWVQRAVAELGQSMGVTSTGLLLLRMVDPENQTVALSAFSYKQLLHEPIVGGGLWTAAVLPFIAAAGIWPVVGVSFGVMAFWLVLYFTYFRSRYAQQRDEENQEDAETAPLLGTDGDGDASQLLYQTANATSTSRV
eukprot:m.304136 g.304136  ORF g.304136 m.304136 type:complete len:508 (-) comp15895_c0_seq6:300-1823(-)